MFFNIVFILDPFYSNAHNIDSIMRDMFWNCLCLLRLEMKFQRENSIGQCFVGNKGIE